MIIFTNEGNPNALKLIIAAKMARKDISLLKEEPSSTYFRLPVISLSCGSYLYSTSAAVQFIVPIRAEYKISNSQWLEWDACQLQPAIVHHANIPHTNLSPVRSLLSALNNKLKDNSYLVQDRNGLSIADVCIWVTIWSTIAVTEDGKRLCMLFPHLGNWLSTIEFFPIIRESVAKFQFERGMKAIMSMQHGSWFPVNTSISSHYSERAPSYLLPKEKEKHCEAVSDDEMYYAERNWTFSINYIVKNLPDPILPKENERNVLITSALPYVNNVPHLGNIIGCVLSADIFARYCRQRNYNTLFISGTDEYGTATETKALEEKTTPQAICDKFFDIHNDVYRWFGIGFNYFGRTSTSQQTEIVQSLFSRIRAQGFVFSDTVDQLLCEFCDRFLADRFVEGTCPKCNYEEARGDQCDGCGHLVNATDLISPRCKVCGNRPVVKKSDQFFLDLPRVEEELREWFLNTEEGWSSVAKVVTKPWLRDGLKPRCITRDLKWGIPVPEEGFRNKVFYVWFDAPFGYISITKRYTKDYEQWWKPETADIDFYQFMAKDNVPFHAIMFPACLLAARQDYLLVNHIMATEYLNYEDTKFSKSRGIGVFGTDARDTGIPADVWRFYLAYIRPETQDSNFNWVDLATKNNSELLNNLGNFVNRALVFVERYFDSTVPAMTLMKDDVVLLALAQRELTSYIEALEQAKLRDGIKHVLAISKHGNQYMQSQEPWVKIKGSDADKRRAGTIIGVCCNLTSLLAALLAPFMPNTSRELWSQLRLDSNDYGYIPDIITNKIPYLHKIGKPSPLFKKIEDKDVEFLRKKYSGRQENENKTKGENNKIDVKVLEAAIIAQGNKVRELKSKYDKSVWEPEVKILLDLKKRLSDFLFGESKASKSATKNPGKASVPE